MKLKRGRPRRREFLHLESQLEPGFEEKAWRRLYEILVEGSDAEPIPIVDQLRLRDRIRRGHMRRERYNFKRRRKNFRMLMESLRPLDAALAGAGMVKFADAWTGEIRPDLIFGALAADARLVKKFIREMEVTREMVFPKVQPWKIDSAGEREAVERPAASHPERSDFERSLEAIPPPAENVVSPEFGYRENEEESTQELAPAAAAS